MKCRQSASGSSDRNQKWKLPAAPLKRPNAVFVLTAAIAVVALLASHWVNSLWEGQDDAYITYSYAKHLAAGEGWIFSPGQEPSYGSTTPLWTMLLAAAARIGVAPHISSPLLTSCLYAVSAVLMFRLLLPLSGLLVAFLSSLTWSLALTVFFRTGGMETALLIVLIAVLAHLLVNPKSGYWPGVVMGLLLLTRPDSLILIVLVFAFWALGREGRVRIAPNALALACVYLPWMLYAWHTFGDAVPSSLRAKLAVATGFPSHFSLKSFRSEFFPDVSTLVLVAVLIWLVVGVLATWKKKPALAPLLTWIPCYWIAMARSAPDYGWYYAPPLWIAYASTFVGMAEVFRGRARPLAVVGMGVLLALLVQSNWRGIRDLRRPQTGIYRQLSIHHRLGDVVREKADPGDLVAAFEVGNLAYWSDRPVLDLMGLTSPEVLPFLESRSRVTDQIGAIIRRTRPRFVSACVMDEVFQNGGYEMIYSEPYRRGLTYKIWERTAPGPSLRGSRLWRRSP